MTNNLYIFPLIKKESGELEKDTSDVSVEDINGLTKHYMGQVAQHLKNHGIPINKVFLKDFDIAYEFFRSSLMRSVGRYHPFQDYVDDIDEYTVEPDSETEETEETEEET